MGDLVIDGGFPFSLTDNKAVRRAFKTIAQVSGGHLTDKDFSSRRTVTKIVMKKLDRSDAAFAETVAEELTAQDHISVAWTILSQTNLTEINYIAKWGRTQLKDGDIITIGERDFVFRLVKVQMTQEEIIASQAPNTPKGKISLDDVDATPIPYPATGLGDNLCNPLWPGTASAAAAGDAPRALSKSPAPVKATSAADQSLWNCIPASIIPLGGGGGPDQTDAVDDPAGDGATNKFSAAGRVRFVNSVKAGDTSAKKKKAEGARREVKEIAQKVEEGTLDPNMKARNSEKSWLTGLFFSV
jgi:hypothetical protein